MCKIANLKKTVQVRSYSYPFGGMVDTTNLKFVFFLIEVRTRFLRRIYDFLLLLDAAIFTLPYN